MSDRTFNEQKEAVDINSEIMVSGKIHLSRKKYALRRTFYALEILSRKKYALRNSKA